MAGGGFGHSGLASFRRVDDHYLFYEYSTSEGK